MKAKMPVNGVRGATKGMPPKDMGGMHKMMGGKPMADKDMAPMMGKGMAKSPSAAASTAKGAKGKMPPALVARWAKKKG